MIARLRLTLPKPERSAIPVLKAAYTFEDQAIEADVRNRRYGILLVLTLSEHNRIV